MKAILLLILLTGMQLKSQSISYPIVDTDQIKFYNNTSVISEPNEGTSFMAKMHNTKEINPPM